MLLSILNKSIHVPGFSLGPRTSVIRLNVDACAVFPEKITSPSLE